MPQVFIGGDSWGTGELPKLEHLGLEQYFREDGYTVFNSSLRGSSNHDSISQLLETLKVHYQPGDYIFWIQSDPIRNLRPYTELPQHLINAGSLKQLMSQLIETDYTRLTQVARRFNTVIHLIGGLTSVAESLIANRSRLNNLVTSWVELLVGDQYPGTDWSNFSICNSDYTIKDFGTVPDPLLVDELYEFDQNKKVFRNRLFHPDGFHPNRYGHQILYNNIKESLKL